MQYTNASRITNQTTFGAYDANKLHSQLKLQIGLLAVLGISHNNLKYTDVGHSTIILDEHRKYWLVDLENAWSLHDDEEEHRASLVGGGSWFGYSHHLYRLSHWLQLHSQQDVTLHEKEIKEVIFQGNLYSLQTTILSKLLTYEAVDNATIKLDLRRQIRAVHEEIDQIWMERSLNRFERIKAPLIKMWQMKETMLDDYMQRNPNLSYLEKSVFSELRVAGVMV